MYLDQNVNQFFTCFVLVVLTWIILSCFRTSLPWFMEICIFNLNTLSYIYVSANTLLWQDPGRSPQVLLQKLFFCDAFSCWVSALVTAEVSYTGLTVWSTFTKIMFTLHLLILGEDRQAVILEYFAISLLA